MTETLDDNYICLFSVKDLSDDYYGREFKQYTLKCLEVKGLDAYSCPQVRYVFRFGVQRSKDQRACCFKHISLLFRLPVLLSVSQSINLDLLVY